MRRSPQYDLSTHQGRLDAAKILISLVNYFVETDRPTKDEQVEHEREEEGEEYNEEEFEYGAGILGEDDEIENDDTEMDEPELPSLPHQNPDQNQGQNLNFSAGNSIEDIDGLAQSMRAMRSSPPSPPARKRSKH